MWINYNDSEVNKYHPICELSLKKALNSLNMDKTYTVIHHQHTGSLEMDFVIQNKITGKYLCVIEIKRTPTDVHSARYQYQAMSYVQMNSGQNEAPYYILTNLEYAFSFRYDAERPRVFQQMLSPGLRTIDLFSNHESEDSFIEVLSNYFEEELNSFLNDRYSYLVTLEQFASHMADIKAYPKKWKSNLVILLYEYIRGAFTFVSRSDLHDVRLFRNDIVRICNEAAHINFREIFDYSSDKFEDKAFVDNNLLSNLFEFGFRNITGDSVADVLHQVISEGHEHEGEVPTDLELSRVLALLAHSISGNIDFKDKVCDPAAGSGNLISSAIAQYRLNAKQIIANDINKQLGELLTLRLGLNFTKVVGGEEVPLVTCEDVCNIEKSYFSDVKVVVMNPPFVAGINAVKRKQAFFSRIFELTGKNAKTDIGQMPLEAVFLELMTFLLEPNTTIACIFPKTHLLARGPEAQVIRDLILNRFGLQMLFTYPGKDLFLDVTKDTCIIVGKIGNKAEKISVLSSYDSIPNIDLNKFSDALKQELSDSFTNIMPGIVGKKASWDSFNNSINDGWRNINGEMLDAMSYVESSFSDSSSFRRIEESGWNMKRGGAANSGGSDLLFFDSRPELYNRFKSDDIGLMAGMRNADIDDFVTENGDSRFLDIAQCGTKVAEEIVDYYMALPQRAGAQIRQTKTKEQWLSILKKESKGIFPAYSVLIPRAIRRKGRVHLVPNEMFVSTNFLVCYGMQKKDAILLSTWISTIFYQLICEVSSKDQEGMRKMEIRDIGLTYIPKFEKVDETTFNKLEKQVFDVDFVDLQSPEIRNVDEIWAEYLFGENADIEIKTAKKYLSYIANKRNT